ncbi:MAG: M28 family peptidase [Actinomycetota bacterium]|nr:M28 family peptidase [Actinomycetota bacterium]
MRRFAVEERTMNMSDSGQSPVEERLAAVVELLCSDPYLPRNTGARGAVEAASYLASELESLGLEPAGEEGYLQEIPVINGSNVLGSIPARSDRWVVLAAHFDACGWENPGANDNAAGVAVVLELARRLISMEPEHSILIALFDAEEPPNFLTPEMGSQWFVDHPSIPLDRIDTMVCLDLIGHALGPSVLPDSIRDSVFVLGAEKGSGTPRLFDSLPDVAGIVPRRVDNYIVPAMSDYHAFMNASIPFLFYTCGRNGDYHEPTDTPDKLDYPKMASLVDHLEMLVTALASRDDLPVYLRDAVDDAATVKTVSDMTEALSPFASGASRVDSVVGSLKQRLSDKGALTDHDRRTIAYLIFSIEESLA